MSARASSAGYTRPRGMPEISPRAEASSPGFRGAHRVELLFLKPDRHANFHALSRSVVRASYIKGKDNHLAATRDRVLAARICRGTTCTCIGCP